MRPVLAQILVMFVAVTSLGAASRLNNSSSKQSAHSVQRKVNTRHVAAKNHARRDHSGPFQVGAASWYGKQFHGKTTASGETYNMFQFTAAHPELPLGTVLKVTNLRNGRWVIVRVNDRGPVPRSRIIDLSYGAATMLGLRGHGVERVRLDVVNPDGDHPELAGLSPGTGGQ